MDWATRRRAIVWAIFGSAGIALLIILGIAIFYKTPTCLDNKQNQGEVGVDCGGPCAHACITDEKPPQLRFARAVVPSADRTDVIAYVDNPNADAAAHGVAATVEVYDANHALLASKQVTFDLTPSALTPVFIDGILPNSTPVTQTFFTIDTEHVQWIRTTKKPTIPTFKNIAWDNSSAPRVSVTLVNPVAQPLTNVVLVATVFDASGQAIAASRTIVANLPSQGTAQAFFTWNVPFESAPARVDVAPVVTVHAL